MAHISRPGQIGFLKQILHLAMLVLAGSTCLAQTPYKGIQPGTSTKGQTERVLGQPVNQVSETLIEYGPQPGAQKIYVQYRADTAIAERVAVLLDSPGQRSTLLFSLGLPASPTATRVNDKGKLEEYFGPSSIVLIYEGEDSGSGVNRVEYYSRELFEVVAKELNNSNRPANNVSASENSSASTENRSNPDRVAGRQQTAQSSSSQAATLDHPGNTYPLSRATATPPPSQTATQDIPDDVGVYIKERGKLVEVHPEVVTLRTGGILKSMATSGLTKGHVNGVVKKPHSPLQTGAPVEFIIRCPEGVSVTEYQLLKLDEKDDRREFRAITGGVFHASSGSEKNAVEFKFEKIAPRTFKIVLSRLKSGEYGFVPPGESNTAMAARIYTFGIE